MNRPLQWGRTDRPLSPLESRSTAQAKNPRSSLGNATSLAKIIQSGQLTHADIASRAGTSRTRVTAIANGNAQDVYALIRILAATGYRAEIRAKVLP